MRTVKYIGGLLGWIFVASALSLAAVDAFRIGGRLFGTVAMARAFDAAGQVILLPARTLFWGLGTLADQSTPLAEPFLYAITNGVLIGIICNIAGRYWWGRYPGRRGS